MTHELKILSEYFVAVRDGIKKFEVRKDDRPFEVGDILCLHEINCGILTGRTVKAEITYILRHPEYCKEGYCILSIKVAQQQTVKHSRWMDDYISREDVLDIVSQYCADDDGSCSKADVDLREMLDEIETLPTEDVQSVKRGRWIDNTFYDPYEKSYEQNFKYECSCCGHMIYNKPNNGNQHCGYCGARMIKDGDKE